MTRYAVLSTATDATSRTLAQLLRESLELPTPIPVVSVSPPPLVEPLPDDGPEPAPDLSRIDVAVALDAESLARATEAQVPLRIALRPLPALSPDDPLGLAHHVILGHDASLERALSLGARRAAVTVIAPLAPLAPAADRAAVRAELAIPEGHRVVVAPTAALDLDDLDPFLVQLALAAPPVSFLFDVARDVDAAALLRARAPRYGLSAFLFAEGDTDARAWSIADAALVRLDGPELLRAWAVGATPLVLSHRARDVLVAGALGAAGLVVIAASRATCSIAIDDALSSSSRERLARGLAPLALDTAIPRTAARIRELATAQLGPGARRALPDGLERISDAAPSARPRPEPAPSGGPEAIERELAELKKRLAGG